MRPKQLLVSAFLSTLLFLPITAFAQSGELFSLSIIPTEVELSSESSPLVLQDEFRDLYTFTAEIQQHGNNWKYRVSGVVPSPNYNLSVSVDGGQITAYVSQTSGAAPQITTKRSRAGEFRLPNGLDRDDISFRVVDGQRDKQDDDSDGESKDDSIVSDQPIDLELTPRRTQRGVGVRGEWEPHPDATGYEKEVFRQDINGQATNINRIKGDPTKLASGLFPNLAEDDGYCYYFQVTVYPLYDGERIDGASDTTDLCVMQNPENEPGIHPREYEEDTAHDRPGVATTTPIDPPEQPRPQLPEDRSRSFSSQLQDVLDRVQELEQLVDYLLQSQAN